MGKIKNIVFFVLFILLFSCIGITSKYSSVSNSKIVLDTIYRVTPKMTPYSIIELIKQNSEINSLLEVIFLKSQIKKLNYPLYSGTYNLKGEFKVKELFEKLSKGGDVFVTLTIPEGSRCEEIASIVSKNFDIDSSVFAKEVLSNNSRQKYGIKGAGNLRGFLMPETYEFYLDAKMDDIIKRLVFEFKKYYSAVSKNSNNKYEMYDVLKMASIVEKEAIVSSEQQIIAGVFYKRLRKGMLLQTDPTVRFASNNFYRPILKSQLRLNHPYNTYVNKGLPPTPICNPGKKAIFASLNPIDKGYLYFMAKFDGTGEHYFARSYAEHQRNVQKGRRNLKR